MGSLRGRPPGVPIHCRHRLARPRPRPLPAGRLIWRRPKRLRRGPAGARHIGCWLLAASGSSCARCWWPLLCTGGVPSEMAWDGMPWHGMGRRPARCSGTRGGGGGGGDSHGPDEQSASNRRRCIKETPRRALRCPSPGQAETLSEALLVAPARSSLRRRFEFDPIATQARECCEI
jgi:hypothetical protein